MRRTIRDIGCIAAVSRPNQQDTILPAITLHEMDTPRQMLIMSNLVALASKRNPALRKNLRERTLCALRSIFRLFPIPSYRTHRQMDTAVPNPQLTANYVRIFSLRVAAIALRPGGSPRSQLIWSVFGAPSGDKGLPGDFGRWRLRCEVIFCCVVSILLTASRLFELITFHYEIETLFMPDRKRNFLDFTLTH